MKQEDKELLLKDLCSRLPYEIKGKTAAGEVTSLIRRGKTDYDIITSINIIVEKHGWRPYLFSLSSITEEQRNELKKYTCPDGTGYFKEDCLCCPINHVGEQIPFIFMSKIIEWLDRNYFDYRGLIEMGLAIDATNLNIY